MVITSITITTSLFPYKWVFMTLSSLKFMFEHYLRNRQYNRLCFNNFPKELKEMGITQEKYSESVKYNTAKLNYANFSEMFQFVIEFLILFFNFNSYVWETGRSMTALISLNPNNEYYAMFFFLLLEILRQKIIGIPFSLYENFVLEERFGFNNTTMPTYIKDLIKSLLLQIILSPFLVSLVLVAISYGGKYFYVYAEVVFIIIFFFMMWLYPNVIAPLFNKFSDLDEGPVKEKIYALARKVEYPLQKIYVIDASTRTDHSNAYLYGLGKNKRIVLYDTLLRKLSPEEIESIVGHELGHWKHSHTIKMASFALMQIFVMFYLFSFFIENDELFVSFGFRTSTIFIGLMLFFNMFSPISFVLEIFQLKMSRTFEYQADEFSFTLGYGDQLQTSLKKLHEKNLSNMDPDPLYSQFNYSHPTLIERCRRLTVLQNNKKKKD